MNTRQKHNTVRQRIIALVALALVGLLVMANALAEANPAPTPADYDPALVRLGLFWPIADGDAESSQVLFQVRQRLQNLGYYAEGGASGAPMLDQADMKAIARYWYEQTRTDYPTDRGLTFEAKDLILQPPQTTDAPREYADIPWGEGSPDLRPMLEKLYHLGYIADITHETYDEAVRDAVRLFTENNGMPSYYANDTEESISPLTADLQRRLIETETEALNPMPEATPAPKVSYFLRKVNLGGMQLSMLTVWIIGLVVLVAGVVVVIYLFMPSDPNAKKLKPQHVHFTITYEGATQELDAEITKTLKIGRGIGDFPLNLQDSKISRSHCELYYLNGALMLRDYSSNGTTVNGKSVHNAESLLSDGDTIVIGAHTIKIKF